VKHVKLICEPRMLKRIYKVVLPRSI
jgi:hypothetical protein